MNPNAKNYLEKNKNINRGYRKLNVWKEAVELFSFINNILKDLHSVSFKIKNQIEDSAFSVSSNIAEGHCRRSVKENIQFVNIALASLGENYTQLYILFYSGIISEEVFNQFDEKHYSLENKLINFNKVMIAKAISKEEWKNDYIIREYNEEYH